MTEIRLTKQGAAHRLIIGAIRYFEHDEADPIVVHVIAASALGILRELIGTRGTSYGERTFALVFWEYALARIEQRKPNAPQIEALSDSEIVDDIEHKIRVGEITSPKDIAINIPKNCERELLAHIFDPFNFLKHADRDPGGSLLLDEVRPIEAIAHAISAYSFLFPKQTLDPEVRMFLTAYLKAKDREV